MMIPDEILAFEQILANVGGCLAATVQFDGIDVLAFDAIPSSVHVFQFHFCRVTRAHRMARPSPVAQ